MIMLWLAVFGLMMTALFNAVGKPTEIRQATSLNADQAAMQVYAYGASINNYINANPNFTAGPAPAFCLPGQTIGCLPHQLGLAAQKPIQWDAYIDKPNGSPRIVLYANPPAPGSPLITPALLAALLKHGGGSLFIGKSLNNGQLFSTYGNSMYAQAGNPPQPQPLTPILNPLPNTDPSNPNHIVDNATVVVWRQ